jgi:UDP-N-acetyl-D-glucosamine dehydrogenase
MSTEFIELAGKINQQMPTHCVQRIEQALNDRTKPIRGSKLVVLGVAYKGGVADIRESPALRIIELLTERGAALVYHDPYVSELTEFGLTSQPLERALADADAVVLITAHPGIDHAAIAAAAELFVDLRGITRGQADNIVRL